MGIPTAIQMAKLALRISRSTTSGNSVSSSEPPLRMSPCTDGSHAQRRAASPALVLVRFEPAPETGDEGFVGALLGRFIPARASRGPGIDPGQR